MENLLPDGLTPEELGHWIVTNSKEEFTDTKREYFTDEQLTQFKDKSHKYGQEHNSLTDTIAQITAHLKKGSEQELNLDLPITRGTEIISKSRNLLDRKISKGFEEFEAKVYGIPSDDGKMYYFDVEGNIFSHRTRNLSSRENHEYNGMFAKEVSLNDNTGTDG